MSKFDITKTTEFKEGKEYEKLAQRIIEQRNQVTVVEDDDTEGRSNHEKPWFDFRTSDNLAYEVKGDTKSIKYGNFFITFKQEINKEWRPAGIAITKADYHMLLFGNSFYQVKTAILKKLITDNTYRKREYINNRGNTIAGYIIPVKEVRPFARVHPVGP